MKVTVQILSLIKFGLKYRFVWDDESMRVLLPFFTFFLTFFSLIWAKPAATVINKDKVLECVIDTRDQRETGAWIWLFSNGLGSGSMEAIAGLKGVDYKIERGRLARYLNHAKEPWDEFAKLKTLHKGNWQVTYLPKNLFFGSSERVSWRLVLFPHDRKEPLFYPESGPVTFHLKRDSLPSSAITSSSLDVAYFIHRVEGMGKRLESLFAFKHDVVLRAPAQLDPMPAMEAHAREAFNSPQAGCIWWDSGKNAFQDKMREEWRKSHHPLLVKFAAVVYPLMPQVSQKLKKQVLDARVKACHFSGKRAYVMARAAEDIPAGVDGVIYPWTGDKKKDALSLKSIRSSYGGPLWVSVSKEQLKFPLLKDKLRNETWHHFGVRLLMNKGEMAEELSWKQVVSFYWMNFLLEKKSTVPLASWLEPPNELLVDPVKARLRWSHVDGYLGKVYRKSKKWFLKTYPSRDG